MGFHDPFERASNSAAATRNVIVANRTHH